MFYKSLACRIKDLISAGFRVIIVIHSSFETIPHYTCGEVAEWMKAGASKASSPISGDVGSNPTLSAIMMTLP